jgi:hypothetical protein
MPAEILGFTVSGCENILYLGYVNELVDIFVLEWSCNTEKTHKGHDAKMMMNSSPHFHSNRCSAHVVRHWPPQPLHHSAKMPPLSLNKVLICP